MRQALAGGARCQKASRLSPAAAHACAPGGTAAREIFAALETGEGVRVGILGDPGSGKSYACRCLVREYLARSRGLVAIANSKGEAGWAGECRQDLRHLTECPPTGREIVFTPDPFGEALDLESVARWQWSLAARRCRSLVVYDELSDACSDRQWLPGSRDLPRVFTHGRRVGISAIWGCQFAQLVPHEPYECSSFLLVFRQAGNALAVLRRRGYTDEVLEYHIAALPGDGVPPEERGMFVLLRRGRPWDGRIYRF